MSLRVRGDTAEGLPAYWCFRGSGTGHISTTFGGT